jgi:hypothetical protein
MDGFEQVTDPADHLKTAQNREVAGDKARAADSYKAAAAGFRLKQDTLGVSQAEDGLAACTAFAVDLRFDHPMRGRRKAYDSMELALRSAIQRTRAGERVRISDEKTVEPEEDYKFSPGSEHKFVRDPNRREAVCKICKRGQSNSVHAKDSEDFKPGDRVGTDVTPKSGVVLSVDGSGDMAKVLVRFGSPDKYGVSDVRKLYAHLLRKSGAKDVQPV